MNSKSILSPSNSTTGSKPFSICVPYGQCDITKASTIGVSEVGMFVGVGVEGVSVDVSGVAVCSSDIGCGTSVFPSFVTYTGTSCPSIDNTTS